MIAKSQQIEHKYLLESKTTNILKNELILSLHWTIKYMCITYGYSNCYVGLYFQGSILFTKP